MVKLVFLSLAASLIVILLFGFSILASDKGEGCELSPFERGFHSVKERRLSVSIQFFLVALVFLIFDVELVMLFPYLFSLERETNWGRLRLVFGFFVALSLAAVLE